MDKIKVTLENWVGKVSFEVSQEKIDEFNEYWEDMGIGDIEELQDILHKGNDFTLDVSTFASDPYLELEPGGAFVCVSEHNIFTGDSEGVGFAFEFNNCEPPEEFSKYLYDGWVFFNNEDEIIKDVEANKKLLEGTIKGDCEIENSGYGVVRYIDFDFNAIKNLPYRAELWKPNINVT